MTVSGAKTLLSRSHPSRDYKRTQRFPHQREQAGLSKFSPSAAFAAIEGRARTVADPSFLQGASAPFVSQGRVHPEMGLGQTLVVDAADNEPHFRSLSLLGGTVPRTVAIGRLGHHGHVRHRCRRRPLRREARSRTSFETMGWRSSRSLTLWLVTATGLRLGSNRSWRGSMFTGDWRRPVLQRLQAGLRRPQKSGPGLKERLR